MKVKDVWFNGGIALDAAERGGGPFIWRFTVFERVLHTVVAVAFFVLAFTGLPLRFSCVAWAPTLIAMWGGAPAAGLIHRWAAGVVLACMAIFTLYLAVRFAKAPDKRRFIPGPDSIFLQRSDFREFWQMLKWSVGRAPKPRFGRYSYRQRFSYFVAFLGMMVIGLSGLLLWFPEWFGRFLPGYVFNVATVIHSYNVMLLAALIVTYHFVDVHLRPNKAPLDGVMFTGRATFAYMQEEHPLLAEAIGDPAAGPVSARAVRDRVAPPPPTWMRRVHVALGMVALALGALLVGLSLWDALC